MSEKKNTSQLHNISLVAFQVIPFNYNTIMLTFFRPWSTSKMSYFYASGIQLLNRSRSTSFHVSSVVQREKSHRGANPVKTVAKAWLLTKKSRTSNDVWAGASPELFCFPPGSFLSVESVQPNIS